MRKFFLFFSFFLAGAFFGKPLALTSLGLFVKAALYVDQGWHFTYDVIDWRQGKLFFSTATIRDKASFSLTSSEIAIDWHHKHLEFEAPHLKVFTIPSSHQRSDWSVSMQEGTLEGLGLHPSRFSFEKIGSTPMARLKLDWDDSALSLEILEQGKELWIEADLKNFHAGLSSLWPEAKGAIEGQVHLVFESHGWKRGAIHLNLHEVGYGDFFSSLEGILDWEGDAISRWPLSFADWKELYEDKDERLRLVVTHGSLQGWGADLRDLKGNLSFISALGAKWEFDGATLDSMIPCKWEGRAFFSQERAHWIESDFYLSDAKFWVKGHEALPHDILWQAGCEKLGPVEWSVLQPFSHLLDPRLADWQLVQGRLNGEGKMLLSAMKKPWDISYSVENFVVKDASREIGCKLSEGTFSYDKKKGEFFLEDGYFHLKLDPQMDLKAVSWTGSGEIEEGMLKNSFLKGKLQEINTEVVATGSLDQFHIETKIPEGMVVFSGGRKGDFYDLKIVKGEYDGFCFSGIGSIDQNLNYSFYLDQFKGAILPVFHRMGFDVSLEGSVVSTGFGLSIIGSHSLFDWSCQCKGELKSPWQDRTFPFYCPVLEKRGDEIHFDVRLKEETWDLVRVCGEVGGGTVVSVDPRKSHFLGSPIAIEAILGEKNFEIFSIQSPLDSHSLFHLSDLFSIQKPFFSPWPMSGLAFFSFDYQQKMGSTIRLKGEDLLWGQRPLSVDLLARGEARVWEILQCEIGDLSWKGKVYADQNLWRIEEAVVFSTPKAEGSLQAHFQGVATPFSSLEVQFSQAEIDLTLFKSHLDQLEIPFPQMEGIVKGEGCIAWKETLESDFDFTISQCKVGDLSLENREPLHLSYSSSKGISLTGLDFYLAEQDPTDSGDFHCKIGSLLYDTSCSLWFLNGAHLHLYHSPLGALPWEHYLKVDLEETIDFCADFCGSRDFSTIACSMKEGVIPIRGNPLDVKNLAFYFSGDEFWAQCHYSHQNHLLKLNLEADMASLISGKLTIESLDQPIEEGELPFTLYGSYSPEAGFLLKEVEGALAGLIASFHATDSKSQLIGTARFDCTAFAQIVPPDIQELFSDLEMGQGYELKGLLSLSENGPSFSGLLSGKQFDFFGFQLRTLLAKMDLSSHSVSISDLKISDSAAIVKVDHIMAQSVNGAPWEISIPHITISELRPSLLQKTGGETGTISPLVVRELKIDDFKGLLDDSRTYTAQGELHFINSYRREHTVFDIPADLLGRIVGLDLELLTPACGTLSYELKEKKFFLKELKNAYSEGHRSEFFLVPTDPVPTMDFDGKLQILVTCKQFVLFKFMESFMISIEGELDDPKFHLQKKKRFWNL